MVRTIFSIESDRDWLDHRAAKDKVARAEPIRRASESQIRSFRRLLEDTSGLWKGEGDLAYQLRLRDEWAER